MKKLLLLPVLLVFLTGIFSFTGKGNEKSTGAAPIKMFSPTEETVTLKGLETKPYIPPKAPGSGGDNDFFGNGPMVRINVELSVRSKCMLYATVSMDAVEIGGDGSHATGKKDFLLYFAGFGNEILSVQTPSSETIIYKDDDHGQDYVTKDKRTKAGEAKAYWNPYPSFVNSSDLIRFCVASGDGDGSEVGTSTGVRVYFNPITLRLKNAPSPMINSFNLDVPGEPSCGESTCSGSAGAGLLHFYGFNSVSCSEVWNRERSVGHLVNFARDAKIANMGMPPNVLRDKLKEWKSDIQLRMLTKENYMSEIRNIIKVQHRPVIALVGWGSRCVEDYYAPADDSYGLGSAILHYVIVEGWDDGSVATANQRVWHIVDNGQHKNWSQEYFATALFWKPENAIVEGILYPQDVHPGNVIY